MILVIGGAFQGKLEFAQKKLGRTSGWVDGAVCKEEDLYGAAGIYHFHELVRRWMQNEEEAEKKAQELLNKNPQIWIISNELGYGVVPMEAFDRKWREKTGRVCTELARQADAVYRVVCGIGIPLKGDERK